MFGRAWMLPLGPPAPLKRAGTPLRGLQVAVCLRVADGAPRRRPMTPATSQRRWPGSRPRSRGAGPWVYPSDPRRARGTGGPGAAPVGDILKKWAEAGQNGPISACGGPCARIAGLQNDRRGEDRCLDGRERLNQRPDLHEARPAPNYPQYGPILAVCRHPVGSHRAARDSKRDARAASQIANFRVLPH